MKIGILTFYRVINFGANLQAISSYYYLKNKGHNPFLIYYESDQSIKLREIQNMDNKSQEKLQLDFVDSVLPNQTEICKDAVDINNVISKLGLDAIIIGSDAVLQHHPLLTRIERGRRKPFYIDKMVPERLFPNQFWGVGISKNIPIAMFSVSSQNSAYKKFSKDMLLKMSMTLERMKIITVRDSWTKSMIEYITKGRLEINITPDPVFAFNYNAGFLVPSEEYIRQKYNIPSKYVLVSLHKQSLSISQLDILNKLFSEEGMMCIAFPMPLGVKFKHNFSREIDLPLSPNDWFALIKYSNAYIGSNMHPIIVSLLNAVPCFSIDHWGRKNFLGKPIKDGSSKVLDILKQFEVSDCYAQISQGHSNVKAEIIVQKILSFPRKSVELKAKKFCELYIKEMNDIIEVLEANVVK